MSVTVQDHTSAGHEAAHEEHPDSYFIKIAVFLFVVTALETSTYWWEDWFGVSSALVAWTLIPMMIVKFLTVALYFMHLKWDAPILRRTFWFGSAFAVIIYVIALSAMVFWENSGVDRYDDPPPMTQPTERPAPPTVASSGGGGGGGGH